MRALAATPWKTEEAPFLAYRAAGVALAQSVLSQAQREAAPAGDLSSVRMLLRSLLKVCSRARWMVVLSRGTDVWS